MHWKRSVMVTGWHGCCYQAICCPNPSAVVQAQWHCLPVLGKLWQWSCAKSWPAVTSCCVFAVLDAFVPLCPVLALMSSNEFRTLNGQNIKERADLLGQSFYVFLFGSVCDNLCLSMWEGTSRARGAPDSAQGHSIESHKRQTFVLRQSHSEDARL